MSPSMARSPCFAEAPVPWGWRGLFRRRLARRCDAEARALSSDDLHNRLQRLEWKLTLAQVVNFRTSVALRHSRYLQVRF